MKPKTEFRQVFINATRLSVEMLYGIEQHSGGRMRMAGIGMTRCAACGELKGPAVGFTVADSICGGRSGQTPPTATLESSSTVLSLR